MTTKRALRIHYQERRNLLNIKDMHTFLASMLEVFRDISLDQKQCFLSYKAMPNKREVPLEIFEQYLFDENQERQFCYPKVDFKTHEMHAYADDESTVWEAAAFGLHQPESGNIVEPKQIDCVLVPLLAFDLNGFRLGYGKGFYDRYLSYCKPEVIKIGFSWFEPEANLPEIHPQDVPLNYCVTPQRLYVF